jgi:hypothetical protein
MKRLKPLRSPAVVPPKTAPAPRPDVFVPMPVVRMAELPPLVLPPKIVTATSPKPLPHQARSGFAMPLPTVVDIVEKRIGLTPLHKSIRADDANMRLDAKTVLHPGNEYWRRTVFRVELVYKRLSQERIASVLEDLECLQPIQPVKMIGYTHSGAWRHQLGGLKFSVRVLRIKGTGHITVIFNNCWFGE